MFHVSFKIFLIHYRIIFKQLGFILGCKQTPLKTLAVVRDSVILTTEALLKGKAQYS